MKILPAGFRLDPEDGVEICPGEKIDVTKVWDDPKIYVLGPLGVEVWPIRAPPGKYCASAEARTYQDSYIIGYDSVTISLSGIFGR